MTDHLAPSTPYQRAVATFADRFWAKVDRSGGPDACWPWIASRHVRGGYGQFALTAGRPVRAHRLAWELVRGPIPDGLEVLHHCDNPPCCNSESDEHLFIGTHAVNMADAVAKGRSRGGTRLLTAEQVAIIRSGLIAGVSQRALGKQHGVSSAAIGKIARGETWRAT